MNSNVDPVVATQLQEFLNRLKKSTPLTQFLLEIREWPKEASGDHYLVLQVNNPAYQFDIHAGGNSLKDVLCKIEESLSEEIGQRKMILLMEAEGIDPSSPKYSRYLN